jgi:20S proteasome alpha/beta subunit
MVRSRKAIRYTQNFEKQDILNNIQINKPAGMTYILGSRCKDGVVLISDRKVTLDFGDDFDYGDKL